MRLPFKFNIKNVDVGMDRLQQQKTALGCTNVSQEQDSIIITDSPE